MNADLIGLLARPRSAPDRFRWTMTTVGAAASGTVLLMAVAIAGISNTIDTGGRTFYDASDGSRVVEPIMAPSGGLARFLSEPGLRPGATLAAALLVVPFLAMTWQALRIGRLANERRQSRLALAGATPGDLRRLAATETGTAFAVGALIAGPLYLLVWVVFGIALPPGARLLPPLTAWMPAAWLVMIVVLAGGGALLGMYDSRHRRIGALGTVRGSPRPPRLMIAALAGLGAIVLAPVLFTYDGSQIVLSVVLGAIVLLVFFAAATIVSTRMTNTTGSSRARNQAVEALAAAQRRADPRSAGRVAAVLFVCGLSFAFETALIVDVAFSSGYGGDVAFYIGGALAVALVGLIAVAVALMTMALSVTDQLLGARRAVASIWAMGAEPAQLVAVQARVLTATAVPAIVAGTVIAGIPAAIFLGDSHVLLTVAVVAVVVGVAALIGVLVAGACRLVAVLLSRRVYEAADLSHLRTP